MNFAFTTLWVARDAPKHLYKMIRIEPCCTSKTVPALLARLGNAGTEFWHGCADLTIADILPPTIACYDGSVNVMLVIPRIHSFLAESLRSLIIQGSINHLSILTDARGDIGQPAISLARQFPNHITLSSHLVADTLLLFPDTAWWGNLGRGEHTGIVTRNHFIIDNLRENWDEVIARYRIS